MKNTEKGSKFRRQFRLRSHMRGSYAHAGGREEGRGWGGVGGGGEEGIGEH